MSTYNRNPPPGNGGNTVLIVGILVAIAIIIGAIIWSGGWGTNETASTPSRTTTGAGTNPPATTPSTPAPSPPASTPAPAR